MSRIKKEVGDKFNRLTCLIVEDNDVDQRLALMMATEMFGNTHEIKCVKSIPQAIAWVKNFQKHGQVSIIFLDWHFQKEENGLNLILFCEENGYRIPILVITIDNKIEEQAMSHENVIGFFLKPIDYEKRTEIKVVVNQHVAVTAMTTALQRVI